MRAVPASRRPAARLRCSSPGGFAPPPSPLRGPSLAPRVAHCAPRRARILRGAMPDPPTPSLAGTPRPRSAPLARSLRSLATRVSRSGPISASVRRSIGLAPVGGGSNARRSIFHMAADPDRVSHITSWPLMVALSSVSPGGAGSSAPALSPVEGPRATNGVEGRGSASSTNPGVSSAIPAPYGAASMSRSVDSSAPCATGRDRDARARHRFDDDRPVLPAPHEPVVIREDRIGGRLRRRLPHAGGDTSIPAIAAPHARHEIGTRCQPVCRRRRAGRTGIEAREARARSCRMNSRVGQEQRALASDRNPAPSAIPRERAILVCDRRTAVLTLQDREPAMRHIAKERDGADPEHR